MEKKKWMTADDARLATFRARKSNVEGELEDVISAIKEAVKDGEYGCTVSREVEFSETLIERLEALGYRVEYGYSMDGRNETFEDRSKLVISWA